MLGSPALELDAPDGTRASEGPLQPESPAVSNAESIEDRVIKIVCNQMGTTPDKVSKETSFVNDLPGFADDEIRLVMRDNGWALLGQSA